MAAVKMRSEDEEMMYYAGLLLELPRLVYMSEFKEAWKQGIWNSTKKRSVRKIRTVFDDFNNCSSLMSRFGASNYETVVKKCRSDDDVVVYKRKRMNPNPNLETKKPSKPTPITTTTKPTSLLKLKFKLRSPSSSSGSGVSNKELTNVGGGDGVLAGKKRKKNTRLESLTTTTTLVPSTELNPPSAKKHKSSLKVTFKKFSGKEHKSKNDGHTIVGHKDSSISSNSDAIQSSTNQRDRVLPVVQSPSTFLPDLNIPIIMSTDDVLA